MIFTTTRSESFALIDGSGFLYRAFHALPSLTTPQGVSIGAVVGFCSMVLKWQESYQPTHWAMIFDKGRSSFRCDLFPSYKAQRPSLPSELADQWQIAHAFCHAINLPVVESQGIEADDLIASLATHYAKETREICIVSSDKDMGQLIKPGITLYDPLKDQLLEEPFLESVWGVPPSMIPFVQALAGDKSDNIPGIPGIGLKTAGRWIKEYGSLDAFFSHGIETLSPHKKRLVLEHKENVYLYVQLATLKKDLFLDVSLEDFRYKPPHASSLETFLDTYHLSRLKERCLRKGWIKKNPVPSVISCSWSSGNISLIPHYIPSTKQLQGIGFCSMNEGKGYLSLQESFPWSDPSCLKIVYDAKQWLWDLNEKEDLTPFDDILLLASLVGEKKQEKSLKSLSSSILGCPWPSQETPEACIEQAEIVAELWLYLRKALKESHSVTAYECLDRPLVPLLFAMEKEGICLDKLYLEKVAQEWDKDLADLEKHIYTLCGRPFSIASPKQLSDVLFNELKLPGGKKGKSGFYHTSSDVLQDLALQGHEVVHLLLKWRHLSKLRTTYTDSLLKEVNASTGRLSTTYSMTSTSTGRLSSLWPNLQNIPTRTEEGRKIRHAFYAPDPSVFICIDYSQIELRILAHMGKVKALQEAFQEGVDIHKDTACHLFHVPLHEVTQEQRRRAKTVNFGIIYGLSAFGLSQQLSIPIEEAHTIMDLYFKRYPGIQEYKEACQKKAEKEGYVTTLWGRRCYIPHIHSHHYALRSAAQRQAINAPLQGTSADFIKRAMINTVKWIKDNHYQAKILLQIHDELILEVHQDEAHDLSQNLAYLFSTVASLSVPLEVNKCIVARWSES